MANEKVDVVIVGAGASGSTYAAVLAKAGKKVVVLEQGPDWQLSDLISSDFWGRRVKPAGAPFLLEGKNPVSYGYQGGWGVGGAALHYFANFPRLSAERLPDQERAQPGARLADFLSGCRALLRQGRARHRRFGRRQGGGDLAAGRRCLSDAADEDLPQRRNLAQGLRGSWTSAWCRPPSAMNSTEYKGRPACIYDGWCHVGCPIGALANPTGDLPRRCQEGRRRGASLEQRHARSNQRAGHQGHRRRVLRPEEGAPSAGGERGGAGRLGGAESAPVAQFVDRQASRRGSPMPTASSANT